MPTAANMFDRSKTTVASVSTELLAASPGRLLWRAQAPQGAELWVNPLGGVAGPGLTGCFQIPAGTNFGSSMAAMEVGAVTYWCATAGLIIPVITYH